ncbi:MAG: DUF1648 domain-containing protein [Nitriliruptor sp.]|nr:MAG: DUF1648 domain-containing protein [Nitriliruptor sp.]
MAGGPIDHRPDTRLGWALGTIIVGAAFAPVVVALVLGDRLPAEVPRHYGADGQPTAVWPLWTSVTFLTLVTLLTAGGCAAACVLLRQPLALRRILAWGVTWIAVWLGGTKVGALLHLVDTTDAMASGSISTSTAVALLAGMLLGVPVAVLAREQPHGQAAAGPPPTDLGRLPSGSPAVWRSAPLTSRGLIIVMAILSLVFLVPAFIVGPFGEGFWLLLLAVACCVPALLSARVRVHIDHDGLHVRGLGVRLVHVPVAEVAYAAVIDHLDAFWEFGGWGLRVDVHGRTGIVSRAGQALRVVRGDDTELLITVDDAATAAATLNTLAEQHQTTTPRT